QLFGRLLDQPVGFFTDRRSGDLLSRINTDIDGVEDVVTDTVFGLVSSVLVTITTLALMLRFSWQLTLVVLAMIPTVALPARRAGRATHKARARTQSLRGADDRLPAGDPRHLRDHAGQGVRPGERRAAAVRDDEQPVADPRVRQNLIGQWFGMLMSTLQTARPALMILFGGWLVITGRASVGTVFVFATVLGQRLAGSVTTLAGMHVNITGSLALFGRLFTYIDRVPEIADSPGARDLGPVTGQIRLNQVPFSYPGTSRAAVADLTVTIEPGQLAALVGPTGAGKTTITGLVAGFHDPQHGQVLIDDTDLRQVTRASLAAQLGMVFQDTFLFHASIADNMRYARPGASDADLVHAAQAAHLDEFIGSLPDGYDTVVEERGHRLSGGENNGWRSPGSSCATRGSSSWTRPPPTLTASPNPTTRPPRPTCCEAAPRWLSPTGCRRSWPPTPSSSPTRAGSSARAPRRAAGPRRPVRRAVP